MNINNFNNTFIGQNLIDPTAEIHDSYIEGSIIGANCKIGPFAHLRTGSVIGKLCRIGNYVEIKNSKLGDGTKVAHLAYVGDAEIGKNVNIGCGVIFANYNGKEKNKTTVGDNTFIGSNSNIIAPCKIGKNCFIAAGTTVDKDIPDGAFVIGRSRMEIKEGMAKKYIDFPPDEPNVIL